MIEDEKYGGWKKTFETDFAKKAFWDHTPLSSLKEPEDIAVRHLMNKVKRYSVDNQLCKMFRKLDKERMKIERFV